MRYLWGFTRATTLLLTLNTLQAGPASPAADIDKTLKLGGVTFRIQATNEGSRNRLTITPGGVDKDSTPVIRMIDGTVTDIQTADLNSDGFPELYIFITAGGSGSYGSLIAYTTRRKKSLSTITLPELTPGSREKEGYMGHDHFSLGDGYLIRRFPVYKKSDPNCCPSGGERRLYYVLVPGKTGWVLKAERSETLTRDGR